MALEPEPSVQASEQTAPPTPAEFPFILKVSDDKLQAELVLTEDPAALGPGEIKKFLAGHGITFGLIDEEIEALLRERPVGTPRLIAKGRSPKSGKDAEVAYYFDRDPLKIGTLRAGGSIDFKAKGEIPQVKEGFLLAEKTPLIREKDGIDVYGNPIPAEKANDLFLYSGPGVKSSPDGLKFYAGTNGRPELLADGKLYVFPEFRIEGDVGLETGHIDFDGYVNVSGTVQEGFRVRGARLSAKEIQKADIAIEGDISVDGGIIGAQITCKGNLRARYIHSSQVEVLGNIFVEAEVIDSRIEANGTFMASYPSGKIFSSQISAREGIEVHQIGSASSRPCLISVKVNAATTNLLNQMKSEILKQETDQQKFKDSIEDLKKEWAHLEKEIGKTAQLQDQALQAQRAGQKKIEGSKAKKDAAGLAQAQVEMERLNAKASSLEKTLDQLMTRQDEIAEKIPALKQSIEISVRAVEQISKQMEKVVKPAQSKAPAVKVNDILFAGTELEGVHSSLTVQENLEHVLIEENQATIAGPAGPRLAWAFEIKRLH